MQSHHRDTLIVAILAFAGGLIFVLFHVFPFASIYALLGKGWAYGWASAIATAAVGVGANRIAKAAHMAKEQDGLLQRMREYESDTVRWTKLRSALVGCRLSHSTYEMFLEKNPALSTHPALHVRTYRTILVAMRKCIPSNRVSSTEVPIEDDLAIKLEALDVGITLFTTGIEEFLREHQLATARPSKSVTDEFLRLIASAKEVRGLAEEVGDKVDALRPKSPTDTRLAPLAPDFPPEAKAPNH